MNFRGRLPEPVILGRNLKPYTVGHDLILHALESGFAIGTENAPTFDDLIVSTYLCSFHFDEAKGRVLDGELMRKELEEWGREVGEFDACEPTSQLIAYIKAYTDAPEFWIEDKPTTKRCGAPLSQILKVSMMRDFHMTEHAALHMPFNEAQTNYLTHLEMNGRLRFADDDDHAAVAAAMNPEVEKKLQALAQRLAARN